MSNEKFDRVTANLSVADISTAIATGLQRALDTRGEALRDKILIYGGRIDFNIQVLPQGAVGELKEVANIGKV
ncbi:hypothetical protein A3218_22420 [Pseudomonas chlororaphis]|uniref:hypothetical protein n=1 Tax=Pseudomonas chlororaphis TaxID=587753 RepID=UPI000789D298|nr:hypothetical protein [Pseudomonas chlororaphis]AMS16925.1 hypothetical protein A3218_22420 [Pseudomonas chlororaphis]